MPEIITIQDAQYAFDVVKTICTEVGPGLPGSSQERERALIIKKELENHLGAENVAVEEFTFAPGAFLGMERLNAIFMLGVVLLNIVAGSIPERLLAGAAATAALLFAALPMLLFVFQFIRAGEIVDPLFEYKKSINVIGTLRKPGAQQVKRLLILGGHHDSAWEDTLLRWLGYGFYFATGTLFLSMVALPLISLIQLTGVISGSASLVHTGTVRWFMLIYPLVPAIIFGLFWHRAVKPGGIVPGAVDNLTASALAVATSRFLVEHPKYIPDDTEIRFVSFGSEEAGLRGSRRYVACHLVELKGLDARLLNYEMVAYPEIAIMTSDRNGTIKNDPEMVKSVVAAAERAGVPYQVKPASLGTCTDTVPFSQAGLKATTLVPFKLPQQFVDFYHQREDGPDKVSIEPLLNALKLNLEWIRCGGK